MRFILVQIHTYVDSGILYRTTVSSKTFDEWVLVELIWKWFIIWRVLDLRFNVELKQCRAMGKFTSRPVNFGFLHGTLWRPVMRAWMDADGKTQITICLAHQDGIGKNTVYMRLILFNKFNRQSVELFLERSHLFRSSFRLLCWWCSCFFSFAFTFIAIDFSKQFFRWDRLFRHSVACVCV